MSMVDVPEKRAESKFWRVFLLAVLLCHVLLVVRQFPPHGPLSGRPLISGDLSIHHGNALEARMVLDREHPVWGYSPYRMAGYPYGVWNSFSKKGHEGALALLPGGSAPIASYAYILFLSLLTPLLVAVAARILGPPFHVGWTLTVAVVLFQVDSQVSYFWSFGNTAYPFTCALGLVYLALLWRAVQGRRVLAAGAGLTLGAMFWLHQLATVPALVVTPVILAAAVFLQEPRVSARSAFTAAAITGVVAALVASPFLLALFQLREYREAAPMLAEPLQADLRHAVMDFLSDRGFQRPHDRRLLLHGLLALACAGGYFSWRRRELLPLCCLAGGILCLGLTYCLCYIPTLRAMQPYRFLIAAEMLWLIPAVLGLLWLKESWSSSSQSKGLACVLAATLAPGLTAYALDLLQRDPATAVPAETMQCLTWLHRHAEGGRILADDGVLTELIPGATGRPVIGGGGNSVMAAVPMYRVNATESTLLGKDVQSLPAGVLSRILGLYDIRWVVTAHPALTGRLENLGTLAQLKARVGGFRIYRVAPPQQPELWAGVYQDRVRAEGNRISLVGAPSGRFVLPYHFVKGVSAGDGVTLSPILVKDAPLPFIQVENPGPQRDLVLRW